MSLPSPSAPCWQRLAGGGLMRIRTDNIGLQMLAKRLERSPAAPVEKAAEIHEFFAKWQGSLTHEIAQFAQL